MVGCETGRHHGQALCHQPALGVIPLGYGTRSSRRHSQYSLHATILASTGTSPRQEMYQCSLTSPCLHACQCSKLAGGASRSIPRAAVVLLLYSTPAELTNCSGQLIKSTMPALPPAMCRLPEQTMCRLIAVRHWLTFSCSHLCWGGEHPPEQSQAAGPARRAVPAGGLPEMPPGRRERSSVQPGTAAPPCSCSGPPPGAS